MRHRLAEPGDLSFLGFHQRVEPGNLDGVVALLMTAEPEQIGDVLRPPAVEEQAVLVVDRLEKPVGLAPFRTGLERHTRGSSIPGVELGNLLTIDPEFVPAWLQSLEFKLARGEANRSV